MESTGRTSAFSIAAVCATLALAVAFRHSGHGNGDPRAPFEAIERAAANVESRGWSAREFPGDAGVPAAGGASGDAGRDSGSGADGSGAHAGRSRSAERGPAGEFSVVGKHRVEAPERAGSGAMPSDAIRRAGRDARRRAADAAEAGGAPVADANSDKPRDPDAPVLSLPLEKSVQAEDTGQPVAAQNVDFDGSGRAVFGADSKVAVPGAGHVNGDAGSIAFWVEPQWAGSDDFDANMLDLGTPNMWANRMHVLKNGRYLRFMFFTADGAENGVSYLMDGWQPNEPHHIAASWGEDDDTGARRLSFYVDGRQVGSQAYDGEFQVPTDQSLFVGNRRQGDLGALATINSFQVYGTPATQARIDSLFGSRPHP